MEVIVNQEDHPQFIVLQKVDQADLSQVIVLNQEDQAGAEDKYF